MNLRLGKDRNNEDGIASKINANANHVAETDFDQLQEDKKLRTANSKVFVLPNGDYRKVVYARDVHYYNEKEEAYRAIDNTFVPILDKNFNEISGYENRYNSCKIRLAAKLENGKLMSISKGNYNISWELIEDAPVNNTYALNSKIRKVNKFSVARVKEVRKKNLSSSEKMFPTNLDGEVVYENAFDKADLQYVVHANAVKENIIIREQSENYEFAFKITTKNLTVKLSEDKQKLLFCSQKGINIFRIPMPVMQDAAGKSSSDIYYDIEDCGEGESSFIFKIIADTSWVNAPERVLPVTIDPMIESDDYACDIQYCFKNNANLWGSSVGVNGGNSKGIYRLFVKLGVPDFGKDTIVNSVKLNVDTKTQIPEKFKGLVAYRMSADTKYEDIAFDTDYDDKALDMVQFLPDNVASIDLTEYFENVLYRGKYTEQSAQFANNGIVIRALNEDITENNFVDFGNNFNLTFDYKVNSGMHKNQVFTTNDLGRSGVSQVNLRTGSLTFVHEDINVEGNRFPVNILNVYNSYAANGGYDMNGTADSNYPKFATNGWKFNYQQFLIPEAYVYGRGSSVQRFRYIDGEGTTHYLENKGYNNSNIVFADEDGLGLTIYIKGATWDNEYTVYDSQKNRMVFNGYRLVKIIKRSGDETIITYRDEYDRNDIKFFQIDSITINTDRKVQFEYNSYNLLTSITYKNEKISYVYNYYKRLTSVTYPDGNRTEFTYTGNGALASVKDVSGKKLSYTYKSSQPFMVEKIAESTIYSSIDNSSAKSGSMLGKSLTISYISKNLVRTTDEKNIHTIYNFDSAGNATAVFENGNADTNVMTPVSDLNYSAREQAHSVSCTVPFNANNYAPNAMYTIDANCQNDTKVLFLPSNMLSVGKTYIVSGFAKADSATINEEDICGSARTFELTAIVAYKGSNYKIYHAKFDDKNTSWQTAATAFKVEENVTGVTVYASYRNNINSVTFSNIKFIQHNANITERKICLAKDSTVYFDAEEITETKYRIKVDDEEDTANWPIGSHTQKLKYSDVEKMMKELRDSDIITVRARDGQYLVPKATAVSFVVKGQEYELRNLIIKGVTFTDARTVESEYNPYADCDGTKFVAPFNVFSGYSNAFTMADVTAISYVNVNGVSETKDNITENDVVNTIKAVKDSKKIVYFNNCKEAATPKNTYQVYVKTKNGTYQATQIILMQFSESRKTIIDNSLPEGKNKFTSTVRYDEYGQKIWEKDVRGIETSYGYDEYGNMTGTTTRHDNSNSSIVQNNQYYNGDHLTSETDGSLNWTSYGYNADNGLLDYSITPQGQSTYYNYDRMKNISGIESNVETNGLTQCNRNSFSYNKDYLTQVNHNGLTFDFTYSGLGDITEVAVAGKPMLRSAVTYSASGDTQTTVELNENGYAVNSTETNSDRYGRVKEVRRNTEVILQNSYNGEYGSSKLNKTIDKCAGVEYNYYYEDGELSGISYRGSRTGSITLARDARKRVTMQKHVFGDGATQEYYYSYESYPDGDVAEVELGGRFKQSISRDCFNRLNGFTLQNYSNSFSCSERYNYDCPPRSGYTTPYIDFVEYTIGNKTEMEEYGYDGNGNIKVIHRPRGTVTYEYDGLNRIVQEINGITNRKYNYTYDAGGNILTKKVTNMYSQQVEKQYTFTYDYSNKDRLVKFGNESISGYDMQGRPNSYRGWTLNWTNGRVVRFIKNDLMHYCAYNANGIRIRKIANGLSHEYYLEDNKIVREVVTGSENYELQYMYGANGIVGFIHKKSNSTATYFYRKNLLGDIVAVYGEDGTKHAEYAYDAWGNCTVLFDLYGVGKLNPIRYRGYYWDGEFGLYYLNARYYDPEIGRFISQDSIKYIAPLALNGLNLFAYCLNNPLKYIDSTGNLIGWLIALAIAAVAIGVGVATGVVGGEIRTGYNKTVDEFDYYVFGTYEVGGGTSALTKSNTPITFYLNVPDKWWKFWEYGAGIDININGYGASLTLSPQEINLSINLKDSSHSVGMTFLGRLFYEQQVSVSENSYAFERFSLNFPEIAVAVLICVYAPEAIPALLTALAGVAA